MAGPTTTVVSESTTVMSPVEAQAAALSRALRAAATRARSPVVSISGGAGFRERRSERIFRLGILASFVCCVCLPLLVLGTYWAFVATPQYATEFKFAIRGKDSVNLGGLAGLFGLGGSGQAQNTQIVANYIRSRAAIEAINSENDLRAIFSRNDVDYFSRLPDESTMEQLEKYWGKHVSVSLEALSAIVSVEVRAFSAQDSLKIAQSLLRISEFLVNSLSTKSRKEFVDYSQAELERAQARLRSSSEAMRDARNSEGVLDAAASAQTLDKVNGMLKQELSVAEQDLATQTKFSAGSPQVSILNSKIAAIRAQIDEYSHQIAGDLKAPSMADRLNVLAKAQVELDLGRQQYATAAAAFESARVALETREVFFAVFEPPALAEKGTYPHRMWKFLLYYLPILATWALLTSLAVVARNYMAK
jgi:capsular polysaccharide transport system permease protein